MTKDAERWNRWDERRTDRCEQQEPATFVLDADRWNRFVELLGRPPQDEQPGLEKLFSKPSVFSAT